MQSKPWRPQAAWTTAEWARPMQCNAWTLSRVTSLSVDASGHCHVTAHKHKLKARQKIATSWSPYWLQWDAPHLPPKLPLSLRRPSPRSNTPIHRSTLLITPNGIRIQSTVFSQFANQTDVPIDRQVIWHDVSRSLGNRQNFAYFSLWHRKYGK